ncbi:protein FRG1 homolog [Agrilus planipennis]|uniref:Protein FRG1 homolog n=1 Tax=Agrilus planipennis TaxID=224129 RepID=A0A1W4WH20_AGRPL|nr:protein FRG1 homolog [Agrilus planipennis]
MSEYEKVRTGKLLLKGEKEKKKKRKHKSQKPKQQPKVDIDAIQHGNWWKTKTVEDIKGPVAIEFGKHTYIKALDNGLFTLGAPHSDGEGPYPEEILTAIQINERKIALKSGYGKYLSVDKNGAVVGRSDAIGSKEQWEPVFENGQMALSAYTDCFISIHSKDDSVIALSKVASKDEILQIRSQTIKEHNPLKDVPTEEQGSLEEIEVNYVRKFQKFQDKRLRICTEDKGALESAKSSGTLHETLLDRRSKMKSDRYCK